MIEIELRYKIKDTAALIAKLKDNGIVESKRAHIIDEWYAPHKVQSHETQKQWFDEEFGLAYRIRRTELTDGTFKTIVDSKQLTDAKNHNTFHEQTIAIDDYTKAQDFMNEKEYWNWLTIDKTRIHFTSPNPELDIILDEIAGLAEKNGVGAALEIEYQGDSTREEALQKLHTFAAELGLNSDDIFEKSLTVEAMSELAKFKKPATTRSM